MMLNQLLLDLTRIRIMTCQSLSTDHFISAGEACLTHIELLFSTIAIHCAAPDSFHLSIIVPITKGGNVNISDNSNFRGIALSAVYGKI